MTVRRAKKQLAAAIGFFHLDRDSFEIRGGRLVSKDGLMDFPVRKLIAIIPAHGTVMAILPRGEIKTSASDSH